MAGSRARKRGSRAFSSRKPLGTEERTAFAHERTASLSGRQVSQIITNRCQSLAVERRLSPRETEVFILLAQGRTRALIQEELVLAENTVKTHIAHIYAKLDVNNRQDMMDLVLGASSDGKTPNA